VPASFRCHNLVMRSLLAVTSFLLRSLGLLEVEHISMLILVELLPWLLVVSQVRCVLVRWLRFSLQVGNFILVTLACRVASGPADRARLAAKQELVLTV